MCDIRHTIHSDELFSTREHNINGSTQQDVCDMRHTLHIDEPFAMSQKNTNDSCKQDACDTRQTTHSDELFVMRNYYMDGHAAPEPVITLVLLSIYESPTASSHFRVIPVWGLTVIHRLAALGAAWSTNGSHRTRTIRGEPDGWDPQATRAHRMKVPPN